MRRSLRGDKPALAPKPVNPLRRHPAFKNKPKKGNIRNNKNFLNHLSISVLLNLNLNESKK